MIHAKFGWVASPGGNAFQNPYNSWCWQFQVSLNSQYLSIEILHHVEGSEPATTEQTVAHEIHGPASIKSDWQTQMLRVSCRGWFLALSVFVQIECTI
jgi:hypothetical protein